MRLSIMQWKQVGSLLRQSIKDINDVYTLKIAELIEESLTNVNDIQFIFNFEFKHNFCLAYFLM